MKKNIFEKQYKVDGIAAQRLYPNEALIKFIASNFFKIDFDRRKNIKILEVGCGSGANLWMLAKEGFDVYGVDSSETGIKLAEDHLIQKWGVNAVLKVGYFEDLPFEKDEFDVVCDLVSLQHIDLDTSKLAFSEINRVLKTGGLFFSYRLSDASTMYQCSGGEFIDSATVSNICDLSMPLNNNGPISFWSPTLAKFMYEKQSFEIQSIERVGQTYNGGKNYVEYLSIISRKGKNNVDF